MGRSHRIEFPGALYHITSRGNDKRKIFYSNSDRKKYLTTLKNYHERYELIIHCFVLMDNHTHLVMETPQGNLSQVMHGINSGYTNYFNHKYKKVGHLFQGRYKSILVDRDSYLLELSRYVHLNPVRAGMVQEPGRFIWSSYSGYADEDKVVPWVNYGETLGLLSDDPLEARKRYQLFVENEPIENIVSPLKNVYKNIALGNTEYIIRVENQLEQISPSEDLGKRRLLEEKPDPHYIIKLVAGIMSVSEGTILLKRQRNNLARKVALYAVHQYCDLNNGRIGLLFGGIQDSAVSKSISRMEKELEENKELRALIMGVKSNVKV